MAKSSGLADAFYVGGSDLSGDINALSKISGGPSPIDVTDITQSATARLGGLRDGAISFTSLFDPATAHPILAALPTADVILTYLRGTGIGNPAAAMTSKQPNYDGTRGADGSFTFAVDAVANGFGLEWGQQLTAGLRTDTTATNGTSLDTTASASFGGQAYLHVSAFSGTDVTIKIQDSADNSSFSDVASFTFGAITSAPQAARVALSNSATIRRYVRVATTTASGFTSATFAVVMVKNATAGIVF